MKAFLKNWKTSTIGALLIGIGILLLVLPGLLRILAALGFIVAGVGMVLGTDANKIESKVEQYYQDIIDKIKGVDFNSLLKDAEKK